MVVVVPGITGVELVDPDSGRIVWGRGANLFCPRDGGYRLGALELVPGRAIRRIGIGPVVKPIYAPIERLFVDNGWSRGDLRHPTGTADLFFFEYDWRRGNGESAVRLARQLAALAATRGREIGVSLVCQSNGALICRYLAKYGGATLEKAENGGVERIPGVRVEQLVLVGTANGGSLRILRLLNRGRRYIRWLGRTFRPELFSTFDSLFQDLPVYADDLFLDTAGEPLEIDLFDPAAWERYGWSIHAPEVGRRLHRPAAERLLRAAGRHEALDERLARAQRLRRLLDRDLDVGDVRYFSIQNDRIPTAARAVLRPTANGWETLFFGDPGIDGSVVARMIAEGDGHATVSSQRWLPATELEALAEPTHYVDGGHFGMILEPEAMELLLAISTASYESITSRPSRSRPPRAR